jgi:hypothetical protein
MLTVATMALLFMGGTLKLLTKIATGNMWRACHNPGKPWDYEITDGTSLV